MPHCSPFQLSLQVTGIRFRDTSRDGLHPGSAVISAANLSEYKGCDVPVVLTKLKSYSTEPAIFGQHEGRATVSILHFNSTSSDAPDKQIDVTATGERHWGDSVPFMNAVHAVCDKIQKTSL